MSQYFSKPKSLGRRVKVDLDLFNYGTKRDLKNVTRVDASSFSKYTDLANLKSDVDKLDVDTSVSIPVDLSQMVNHLMY